MITQNRSLQPAFSTLHRSAQSSAEPPERGPVDSIEIGGLGGLTPEEGRAIEKIDSYLESISGKLDQHPLQNIETVDPPRWKNEIGFHCDYTSTTRFELGGKTYHLSVSGYKEGPEGVDYDLQEVIGPHPEVENHFITGEEISVHPDLINYDVKRGERHHLSLAKGRVGVENDSVETRAAKRSRIDQATELAQRIERLLGGNIVEVTEGYPLPPFQPWQDSQMDFAVIPGGGPG